MKLKILFFIPALLLSTFVFASGGQWDWMATKTTVNLDPDSVPHFQGPIEIDLDQNGNMYIVDCRAINVTKISSKMEMMFFVGRKGRGPAEFSVPYDVAIDKKRGRMWVADQFGWNILCFDLNGKLVFQKATPKHQPFSIACLSDGKLVVGGTGDTNLVLYDENIQVIKRFGRNLIDPMTKGSKLKYLLSRHMCVLTDPKDNIFVLYVGEPVIECYTPGGELKWKTKRPWILESRKPVLPEERIGGMTLNIKEKDNYHINGFLLNGILYVNTYPAERSVLAFDPQTGKLLGHKKVEHRIRGIARHKGAVYALAEDHQLQIYSNKKPEVPAAVFANKGFGLRYLVDEKVFRDLKAQTAKGGNAVPKACKCGCRTEKGKKVNCKSGCCN